MSTILHTAYILIFLVKPTTLAVVFKKSMHLQCQKYGALNQNYEIVSQDFDLLSYNVVLVYFDAIKSAVQNFLLECTLVLIQRVWSKVKSLMFCIKILTVFICQSLHFLWASTVSPQVMNSLSSFFVHCIVGQ